MRSPEELGVECSYKLTIPTYMFIDGTRMTFNASVATHVRASVSRGFSYFEPEAQMSELRIVQD